MIYSAFTEEQRIYLKKKYDKRTSAYSYILKSIKRYSINSPKFQEKIQELIIRIHEYTDESFISLTNNLISEIEKSPSDPIYKYCNEIKKLLKNLLLEYNIMIHPNKISVDTEFSNQKKMIILKTDEIIYQRYAISLIIVAAFKRLGFQSIEKSALSVFVESVILRIYQIINEQKVNKE